MEQKLKQMLNSTDREAVELAISILKERGEISEDQEYLYMTIASMLTSFNKYPYLYEQTVNDFKVKHNLKW